MKYHSRYVSCTCKWIGAGFIVKCNIFKYIIVFMQTVKREDTRLMAYCKGSFIVFCIFFFFLLSLSTQMYNNFFLALQLASVFLYHYMIGDCDTLSLCCEDSEVCVR